MNFKYVRLYKKITSLVDGPYNAPSVSTDEEEQKFEEEYERIRGLIHDLSKAFCKSLNEPVESIDVGHRTGLSRGVGLVVEANLASNLLALVKDVQILLQTLSVSYSVPINIVLDEEGSFKDLIIAVTKEVTILVYSKKKRWFKEIGINC